MSLNWHVIAVEFQIFELRNTHCTTQSTKEHFTAQQTDWVYHGELHCTTDRLSLPWSTSLHNRQIEYAKEHFTAQQTDWVYHGELHCTADRLSMPKSTSLHNWQRANWEAIGMAQNILISKAMAMPYHMWKEYSKKKGPKNCNCKWYTKTKQKKNSRIILALFIFELSVVTWLDI